MRFQAKLFCKIYHLLQNFQTQYVVIIYQLFSLNQNLLILINNTILKNAN